MASADHDKREVSTDSPSSSDEGITTTKPESDSRLSPAESLHQRRNESPRTVHGWTWVVICISIYTGGLVYGLDTTIAADIQAAIVEQFDNVERLTWVGTAFPLGSTIAVLPM
jgi:hypothetical protein